MAVVEGEEEVVVVGGGLHVAVVGHDDVGLRDAVGVVVDDDIAESAAVGVFFVDTDDVAVDFVVVFAWADAYGGFFALHVVEGGAIFVHGHGEDVVGEVEGHACEQESDEGQRHHDAAEGYASGFHGYEFVFFAKVAHGHDGGKENGDREGHGYEGGGGVEHQFGDDAEVEPFAHKVVDILPHKLHQQHKYRYSECKQERSEEGLEYKTVNAFHWGSRV